ncbi:unnamed protein product [Nippostrongylus brasiliensis]|uniref:Protein ABIL1-like n=1 Tax=Nippostrongylus brasiliensis TaxID=27835 RepID=A0A0N4YNL1_NIPBR|nr:unnamed protein product [Nippostrongylus brasiliensis]
MVGSTSGNDDEQLRASEQEETEYENVSECFKKQFDRLTKRILGQVAAIGTICDAQLGKLVRTNDAFERTRTGVNEVFELARSVVVLAKQNIVSCIPAIESGREEPSHGPGAKPRRSTSEQYSKKVFLDYSESFSLYLKGDVDIPPLAEKTSRGFRTRRYLKGEKRDGL